MSELMEHYAKKDKKTEETRLARMKGGKVVTVYDDTTGGRFPSWMPWVGTKKRSTARFQGVGKPCYSSHKRNCIYRNNVMVKMTLAFILALCYRDLEDNSANPTVCDVDDFLD